MRSMISSIENAPISPGSCRWISTAAPELLGEPEHRVEMALRVAVDRAWIEPADDVSAPSAQRLLQQFQRAGAAPAARSAETRRGRCRRMPRSASRVAITPSMPATPHSVSTSTWLRIWVRAMRDRQRDLPRRLAPRHRSAAACLRALVVDLVDQARSDLVAVPRHARAATCRDGCAPRSDPGSARRPPPSARATSRREASGRSRRCGHRGFRCPRSRRRWVRTLTSMLHPM